MSVYFSVPKNTSRRSKLAMKQRAPFSRCNVIVDAFSGLDVF
jgi:hypothetical protein